MNTSRLGSSTGCRRRNALRAAATSGLSCSAARRLFFKSQFQVNQESGDRGLANGHLFLRQPNLEFRQRDIRLFRYQFPDQLLMRSQNELLVATELGRADAPCVAVKLEEASDRADAHAALLGGVGYGSAVINHLDNASTQVFRVRLRHPCWPPRRRKLESYLRRYGNPPIQPFRETL